MKQKLDFKIVFIITLLGCSSVFSKQTADPNESIIDANNFNYSDYAYVLKTYVDEEGMVNYKQLKQNRQKLDAFVTALANLDNKIYEKWSDPQKIVFWLNAYNALTLKVIIDNYPIKPSFWRSKKFPENSIRQISGVWSKIKFNIMGRKLSLGDIEHKILRKKFDEPRIHMGLVCAAKGCPPLRNKPYINQKSHFHVFDPQTERFLSDPKKFEIDYENKIVYLSPIFKWFAKDFKKYAGKQNLPGLNSEQTGVIKFIRQHLNDKEKQFINKNTFKIKYLKYDWSLNEQEINVK